MKTFSLQGETSIVTGAAAGIGKGITKTFIEAGASVLLVDFNQQKVKEAVAELKDLAGDDRIRYLVADITEPCAAVMITEAAQKAFGRLDILVNCAGIYPSTPSLNISEEEWDKVFDLNVKATFFLAQAAAKVMVQQGTGGRIINITSTASEVARPGVAHYCSSKAAVRMLTQVLALEWAKYGIRVNAVGPGLVETENLLSTLITEEARREHQEKLSYCPMNRAALVEEIAEAVLFFATDQSKYVTGQTLLVDGGYSAGRVFKSKMEKESKI
jgi:NAD(P)-dependent dehydrogenase (short-subunit alcohol dehydrogenase family)